jgi:phospholipid/cholesterol/gamma-HCH transport system permease protein
MTQRLLISIGTQVLFFIQTFVNYFLFLKETFFWSLRPPWRLKLTLEFMYFVGNRSSLIVAMSGFFTGAVLGLQTGVVFEFFQAESMMGAVTAKSLALELAPIICSFIVTARVGAAMAAEIATMRVSEQIDALLTMGVPPLSYLVVPRIVASVLMLPFLTLIYLFFGVTGCYLIGRFFFQVNINSFFYYIEWLVEIGDLTKGLFKSFVFGFVFSSISTYNGYFSKSGSQGVGYATTQSVVISLFSILILDFFISLIQIYW